MQLRRLLAIALSLACPSGMACARGMQDPAVLAQPSRSEAVDPSLWPGIALGRAIDIAGRIDDPYRRAEALARIARAQVLVQDVSAAYGTIERALAAAAQVRESAFRGWVLRDIVQAQIAAEDLHGARETADRIKAKRPQGAALALIADFHLRSGDLGSAQSVARKIRESGAKGEILRRVVVIQVAGGELSEARATLRSIGDSFYLHLALGDIAVAEVRRGNIDSANALAARAKRANRAEVYGRIALARADAGDTRGAAESVRKIDDDLYRALVQARMAAAAEPDAARQLFSSAIAMADAVRGQPERKSVIFAQLAVLPSANAGRITAADLLHRARREADRLPFGEQRNETLDFIARRQLRAGDASGALDTAMQIGDAITRALLVRDIVTQQPNVTGASASASAAGFDDPLVETAAHFGVLGTQLLGSGQPISREMIDRAREAVHRIENTQLKPAALAALAVAHVRIGDAQASWSIFQEALAAADAIASTERRAAAYIRVVNALNERLMFLGGKPAVVGSDEVME